ncbi:HET-domain-containing protein [Dendrothele bispora CBS 962.96]|uniref:HET-domain-containing protein n=1 Tax=Dendrothele bispora (strain CBS 962.96) TaxID=1314807 RepID=A0A4S8LXN2_DENBC|nr:HET-domain-containing protein [Dendrothele bispora CBS 962.96]
MFPVDICPLTLIDTHTIKPVVFEQTDTIPAYAVLSHQWSKIGAEVTYEELVLVQSTTYQKSGYQKINAACQKALQDGYSYIWVDTCCIIQKDEKDLKENIPKMYGFYQNSAVCYVYLWDVVSKTQFRYSEWFKRGWTLQELVAPRTVKFFDSHWQYLGDKHGLREEIFRKTTIPPDILSGTQSVQDIAIVDRMTWALERKTTEKQDLAYCLQGLLGVTVVPNYQEFWLKSFNRLGRALLVKYPELEKELGVSDAQLSDPDYSFRDCAWQRLMEIRDEMLMQRLNLARTRKARNYRGFNVQKDTLF